MEKTFEIFKNCSVNGIVDIEQNTTSYYVRDLKKCIQTYLLPSLSQNKYKFEKQTEENIKFISVTNKNANDLFDVIRTKKFKFICLNDDIDRTENGAEESINALHDLYKFLFPFKSSFERKNGTNQFLHMSEYRKYYFFI